MKFVPSAIPDVLIVEPTVHGDQRGYFFESFNERAFRGATGVDLPFVQDNHSGSARGVLRGLHYQIVHPQGKLVRVIEGSVLDVAVDMRRSSPSFGAHVAIELSAANHRQLWIPPGFAHGFVVRSPFAQILYRITEYWYPEHERTLKWDDPALGIAWDVTDPILSDKDRRGLALAAAPTFD